MVSGLWLVTFAVRSETATVCVVEAVDEREARARALALERAADPGFAVHAEGVFERGNVTVVRARDGIRVDVNAPH